MRENNLFVGTLLAKKFNKKTGIITYSGTLAIELALRNCKLPFNSGVIVSNEVCTSIITTIIKLGLKPIIVVPQKDFMITSDEIEKVINLYPVSCILLVHQYGIINNIECIKEKYTHIKIIEDIAQTWSLKYFNTNIGKYSDYIVTSFGKTKPLSYGIGGAVITNEESILNIVDFCDNISRENKELKFAYAYPLCEKIELEELFVIANEHVIHQQQAAQLFLETFQENNQIYLIRDIKKHAWHRFPLWIKSVDYYKKMIDYLKECEIEFQLPHNINNYELPSIKDNAIIPNSLTNKENIILLRTRINDNSKLREKL